MYSIFRLNPLHRPFCCDISTPEAYIQRENIYFTHVTCHLSLRSITRVVCLKSNVTNQTTWTNMFRFPPASRQTISMWEAHQMCFALSKRTCEAHSTYFAYSKRAAYVSGNVCSQRKQCIFSSQMLKILNKLNQQVFISCS